MQGDGDVASCESPSEAELFAAIGSEDGPGSFAELQLWPQKLWMDLKRWNRERATLLMKQIMVFGLVFTTHYSGIGCPELAAHMMTSAAADLWAQRNDRSHPKVQHYSACEKHSATRAFLLNMRGPAKPLHVF
eukprot:13209557-Alexandrium_andersonii.AAC.1